MKFTEFSQTFHQVFRCHLFTAFSLIISRQIFTVCSLFIFTVYREFPVNTLVKVTKHFTKSCHNLFTTPFASSDWRSLDTAVQTNNALQCCFRMVQCLFLDNVVILQIHAETDWLSCYRKREVACCFSFFHQLCSVPFVHWSNIRYDMHLRYLHYF